MTAVLARRLKAIGDRFAEAFGLVGWFGVDYVLNEDIPWPVEINPRYTASLEIHELASGRSLLDEHRRACEGITDRWRVMGGGWRDEHRRDCGAITGQRVGHSAVEIPRAPVIAKRILYAERSLVVPDIRVDDRGSEPFAVPMIADVPARVPVSSPESRS